MVESSVAIKIFRIIQDKIQNLIFNKATDIVVSLSVEDENLLLSFDYNANEDIAIYGNVFEQVIMEKPQRTFQ